MCLEGEGPRIGHGDGEAEKGERGVAEGRGDVGHGRARWRTVYKYSRQGNTRRIGAPRMGIYNSMQWNARVGLVYADIIIKWWESACGRSDLV